MRIKNLVRQNLSLIVVVTLSLIGRASFADHYVVPSGSMQPTVDIGDRLVVNKMAYGLRLPMSETYLVRFAVPAAGDVVVLDSPVDDRVLLKRVAAVPGDLVSVREGMITRNGVATPVVNSVERLGRPHSISFGGPDFGPTRLGADQYLLMGDNRGNSLDGRSFGMVSASAILGRAEAIYWHDGGLVWRPLSD